MRSQNLVFNIYLETEKDEKDDETIDNDREDDNIDNIDLKITNIYKV